MTVFRHRRPRQKRRGSIAGLRHDGIGIIAQCSPSGMRLSSCVRKRIMGHLRRFQARPEPECAEFQDMPLKAMLEHLLRDWCGSEKLYAVHHRVTSPASHRAPS